jgi:hypothetical protein
MQQLSIIRINNKNNDALLPISNASWFVSSIGWFWEEQNNNDDGNSRITLKLPFLL